MQERRDKKRLLIIAVYLVFFGLFCWVVYAALTPAATCYDGIQNQNEKGIDCGGRCKACEEETQNKDLIIKEKAVFPGGSKDVFDALIKIENPNNRFGAKQLKVSFSLLNQEGKEIGKKEVESYILPAETKYILALGIQTTPGELPGGITINFDKSGWQKLGDLGIPQVTISSKQYSAATVGEGGEAKAILKNESLYDLANVDITVVLRDDDGKIVAANSTNRQNIRSNEAREFSLVWSYALPKNIKDIEMQAQTNAFDVGNFINLTTKQ